MQDKKLMKKYVVDSNIIVRYLLGDSQELYKRSRDFFDLVKLGRVRAILGESTFTETVLVLSKVYKIPRKEIAKVIINLFMYKGVISTEKNSILKSIELYASTSLDILDCLTLSRALNSECEIMTFDQELKEIFAQNLTTA